MRRTIDATIGRIDRRGLSVGLISLVIIGRIVPATAAPTTAEIAAIVDRLRGLRTLDRTNVEQVLGRRLTRTDGNQAFTFWGAAGRGLVAKIDFREPVRGGTATAGPILVLILGGCVSRREIESRFGPLAITGTPRGRSLDEETALSREESLGRLSFGFAERKPDCLRSLSLSVARP